MCRINSKQIVDQNVRVKPTEHLEGKKKTQGKKNLTDFGLDKDFLSRIHKSTKWKIKKKSINWAAPECLLFKGTVMKTKWQTNRLERKQFQNVYDKTFIQGIQRPLTTEG